MSYEVEKNVPIPERSGGRIPKYPWNEMDIGDSFLVEDLTAYNALMSGAGQRKIRNGEVYTIRKVPEGVRVWRIK